ncbi:hypothetical protein SynPROS91_01882 [Synechococcus sp. PROS-9-1]|nr:hypothetical protein SynPROS91_01882 [Synechococcus sp. PROS-9-1]
MISSWTDSALVSKAFAEAGKSLKEALATLDQAETKLQSSQLSLCLLLTSSMPKPRPRI